MSGFFLQALEVVRLISVFHAGGKGSSLLGDARKIR
jgi:hypothetical protein